jgi:hypothetical protein
MIHQDSTLVTIFRQIDEIPLPKQVEKQAKGHPKSYSDRLILKGLVFMVIRHIRHIHEFHSMLRQPTPELDEIRLQLSEENQFPSRRTWERRIQPIIDAMPEIIGSLGRYLVTIIKPWERSGSAVAIDSTILRAGGGQWHQKHRKEGIIPHTSIDQEAHWTKSGWHGWVYGWKLHLICTVGEGWIPLGAILTPANVDDGTAAPELLRQLPLDVHFVLGDRHYNTETLRDLCWQDNRTLVATKYGKYPHTDDGVEVRRTFHKLRSVAIENFNEHFKGIFDGHGQVPTKGLQATRRFALGAIFVYQLALFFRFQHHLDLCIGLKAFLKSV